MGSYGHSGDRTLVPVAVAGFLRSGRGWLTTLPAVAARQWQSLAYCRCFLPICIC